MEEENENQPVDQPVDREAYIKLHKRLRHFRDHGGSGYPPWLTDKHKDLLRRGFEQKVWLQQPAQQEVPNG